MEKPHLCYRNSDFVFCMLIGIVCFFCPTMTKYEKRKGIKMKIHYWLKWCMRITDVERLKKGSVVTLYETLKEYPENLGIITKNPYTDKTDGEIKSEIMYLTGRRKGIKKLILMSDYDVLPQSNGTYKKENFIIISSMIPTEYIGEIFQMTKLNPAKTIL